MNKPVKQSPKIKQAPIKKRSGPTLNKTAIHVVCIIVLGLVTLFTFWPVLQAGFTNWDDPEYVHSNTCIHQLNAGNIRQMFTEPAVSNYHPLTLLSLAVDYSRAHINQQNGIPEAYPFHQTNLIIHILNVILVYFAIYRLSMGKTAVAFFTAFLFGIHPMHVESVSWIAERKDVLFGFFWMISLIFYLKYIDDKHLWSYWLSLVFFVLSLLSKPAAAPMGMILLLVDYYRNRFSLAGVRPDRNLWKILLEKLPFLVLGLALILITYFIQSKSDTVADFQLFSLPRRVLISFYGFYMYLQKLLLPVNLSAFYPYPFKNNQDAIPAGFYLAFILSIGILIVTFLSVKKTRSILFGVLFYLFMLIPVLQFVSVGSSIISERYTYIPYLGIFYIAGMGLYRGWKSPRKIVKTIRIPVMVMIGVYMATLTVMARQRTHVWNNSGTLWTNVAAQFPNLPTAYKNRGNYYASEAGETEKALKDYEKLLTLDSTDASLFSNLGNIYCMKEEYDKAIEVYSKSIRLDSLKGLPPFKSSYSYNNYLNRGFSNMKINHFARAIPDYTLLIEKDSAVEKFHFNRGLAWANTGSYEKAMADFQECLRLEPNSPDKGSILFNLAACFIKMGDPVKAYPYLQQAQAADYPVDAGLLESIKKQAGIKSNSRQ
ncbi:MAG: tetratricopeptide repeat protein [Bacteroidetes bacterium]|nr:tetratricopeptide repeat protein [Bacteroidota bacterium]